MAGKGLGRTKDSGKLPWIVSTSEQLYTEIYSKSEIKKDFDTYIESSNQIEQKPTKYICSDCTSLIYGANNIYSCDTCHKHYCKNCIIDYKCKNCYSKYKQYKHKHHQYQPIPLEQNEYFNTYSEKLQEFITYWKNNFISEVSEFYVCQLVKKYYEDAITEPEKIPGEEWCSQLISNNSISFMKFPNAVLTQMNKRINRQTKKLSNFFRIYEWISCFGEARHSKRNAKNGNVVKIPFPKWIGTGKGRQACWQDAFQMWDNISENIIIDRCMNLVLLFDHMKWNSAYGGAKWGFIIKTMIRNICGEIPNQIFVDMSVSLVHNGNLFVDKLGIDTNTVRKLLDYKFKSTIYDANSLIDYIKNPTYDYEGVLQWVKINSKNIQHVMNTQNYTF